MWSFRDEPAQTCPKIVDNPGKAAKLPEYPRKHIFLPYSQQLFPVGNNTGKMTNAKCNKIAFPLAPQYNFGKGDDKVVAWQNSNQDRMVPPLGRREDEAQLVPFRNRIGTL